MRLSNDELSARVTQKQTWEFARELTEGREGLGFGSDRMYKWIATAAMMDAVKI